ncbi:hypothetical protein BCR39DRAFT_513405 [Naematelia encephala]|uniref:YMC020W-like alpha/beta hydrolase domain-containing protein n=1 Tax=Naematelia encephala TaxID=71784 RepID=A0A1Y2BJ23_9TREE|nr:hypothetical protein BCR39DRAFT_513405 [Naematelia encephala]
MSSTPRKSSIRSRVPPSSLRLPSQSRKVSNPHLTLVFAQGDPTDSARRPSLSGLPASEEALSRQLDGDLGGRQMGLRSRRSSTATVRTVRTSGVRSPSPSASVKEEVEDEAGPSTPEPTLRRVEPEVRNAIDVPQQRLNPKASSSWLRWNSPAPSFPRSVSTERAKGKRRADPSFVEESIASTNVNSNAPDVPNEAVNSIPADAESAPVLPHLPLDPSPSIDSHASLAAAQQSEPPLDTGPSTVSRGRNWWTRASVEQRVKPENVSASVEAKETEKPNNAITAPPSQQPSNPDAPEAVSSKDMAPLSTVPAGKAPSSTRSSSQVREAESRTSGDSKRGWKGYLAWSAGEQKPPSNGSARPDAPLGPPAEAKGPSPEPIASIPSDTARTPAPTSQIPPPSDLMKPPPKSGWGTYLYSYVASATTPAAVHSPTAVPDQVPISESPQLPVSQDITPTEQPTANVAAATIVPSPIPPHSKEGAATTAGWLNYLAFRAGQKQIANPSIKTGETGEEVMDFSTDPEFPDAPSNGTVTGDGNSSQDGDKTSKIMEKNPSSSLAVRKKRMSISSTRSGASLAPLSSPSSAPTPAKTSSSALPPPPAPPTVQQNLLIPTFQDIFDRPPRSYPRPSSMSAEQKASGLAWRALAAAGSYVYGQVESSKVNEKETRGRGAGKDVGSELPRRIGLGGGDPDGGWKGVTRVVVVGVHGWFPAKMLNSVIGEPTGTSQKFASMMGQAVRKFFADKGMNEADLRLTLMPLEGEGTIDGRVDRLYKAYLSNPAWINDVRRADAVFFAAHSQGCIVTTHLVSRMIAQGHLRTPLNAEAVSRCEWAFGPIGVVPDEPRRRKQAVPLTGSEGGYQKVAMLAMCGVHLGPLHSISTTVIQPYLQWFENAAARELFEFQDTNSAVSMDYQKALSMCLENEVRVILIAGLNDQVVPIYGATFSTATHPLLLRALFVDGASYSRSDFMTNLLAFALLLRNAGLDDQRLVEHLSEATAGSLTGIGHSTPYEDPSCYALAVDYLFHAGPAASPMPPLQVEPFAARDARNDFELPWIMRALVDSPEIKDLFPTELKELKEGIVAWRPTTKALKEIKRRLEPMAGRQSRLRSLQTSASSTSLAGTAGNEGLGSSPAGGKGLGIGLKRDW